MKKRQLGASKIAISEIGLGLWAIGGDQWGKTEDRDSLDTIDAALSEGVNFFDTADVYGGGHSEEILGQAMKGRRDQFIVGTKIGWIDFDGEKERSQYDKVGKVVQGVEDCLKRMQTDYIDLIQCHIDFQEPNMEIMVEGFQLLQEEGKIRAYGVSTSDFEYLKTFNSDDKCSSLQIDYSILNRTAEKDIFPYCKEHGIGVLVRGPLAMGILTGKFDTDVQFEDGDFRRRWLDDPAEKEQFFADLEKVERLREMASDQRSLAQLAIQFSIEHNAVSSTIPGAKTVSQLKENVSAAKYPAFSPNELDLIGQITPFGGGRKIWPA